MRLSPPHPGRTKYTTTTKESARVSVYTGLTNAVAAILRTDRVPLPQRPLTAAEFAASVSPAMKFRARGGKGEVYTLTATRGAKKALAYALQSMRLTVGGDRIPTGAKLAVKITAISKKADWQGVVREGLRESLIHERLMHREPFTLGSVVLDPRDVVPPFYFGGCDPVAGVHVIVMGFVPGKPVDPRRLTPAKVAAIEKAVLTLHAFGVVQGDLHLNNVFFGKHARIIDFGMSLLVPAQVGRVRAALGTAVARLRATGRWPADVIDDIWYGPGGLGEYTDAAMHALGFTWYNPNGKTLRFVQRGLSTRELDAARAKLWR